MAESKPVRFINQLVIDKNSLEIQTNDASEFHQPNIDNILHPFLSQRRLFSLTVSPES